MDYTVHDLQQGSPEWLEYRRHHFNASKAAAMLGCDLHQSRNDFVRETALSIEREVSPDLQARFDDGHRSEAAARVLGEEVIGEPIAPLVCSRNVDGLPLSASYDGLTASRAVVWEHKWQNKALAAALEADQVPDEYAPQLEQQMLIVGAQKALLMCSDGTRDSARWAWYESNPALRERIIAGWKQFAEDVAGYTHVEYLPAPVGTSTAATLPALIVRAKGEITESNFAEYKKAALAMIGAIKTDLETDADFDDAAATVKDCVKAEENLQAMKRLVLGGMADVQTLLDGLDELDTAVSKKRTFLKNLIESRRVARRAEIIAKAQAMYAAHIESLKAEIGGPWIVLPSPDFAGAVKSLRTIATQQNAVDTALANGKIAADASAKLIRANLACMKDDGAGYEFLFRDQLALIDKPIDDLRIIIKSRIDAHKAAEAAKEEATRERIRADLERETTAKRQEETQPAQEKAPPEVAQDAPRQRVAPILEPWGIPPRVPITRPSDDEIIETIALHYRVHESKVLEWLFAMNLNAASDRLGKEFAA